jgi:hypothetical protein
MAQQAAFRDLKAHAELSKRDFAGVANLRHNRERALKSADVVLGFCGVSHGDTLFRGRRRLC